MLRPSFTVELTNGKLLDANHLAITLRDGKPVVSFECSGSIEIYKPEEIIGVSFGPPNACWCPWCDSRIDGKDDYPACEVKTEPSEE